jgi:hypothetical protein
MAFLNREFWSFTPKCLDSLTNPLGCLYIYVISLAIIGPDPSALINMRAIALFSLFLLLGSSARGQDDAQTQPRAERSIEAFTHSADPSTGTLGLSSEYENRNGEFDQAIRLAAQALKKDPADIDLRIRYADALQNKLTHQKEKDAKLFNTCVTAWLAILRNEGGDEQGQTLGGIGLPLSGQLFGDEERVMPARRHLQELCGVLPKAWETDKHYLHKVLVRYALKGEMRKPSPSSPQLNVENKLPADDYAK